MNGMFWKRCGVGKIYKHYGVGHGTVPYRPLFLLFSHTSAHTSLGAHTSAHTSLGAHTSTHMNAHTSLGAQRSTHARLGAHTSTHTSTHRSFGAHTSVRMCFFALGSYLSPPPLRHKIRAAEYYSEHTYFCYRSNFLAQSDPLWQYYGEKRKINKKCFLVN